MPVIHMGIHVENGCDVNKQVSSMTGENKFRSLQAGVLYVFVLSGLSQWAGTAAAEQKRLPVAYWA